MKKLALIVVCLFLFSDLYAYLDPGTGSYVLQIIIAGIASALLGIKVFWNNIKSFFASLFGKKKEKKDK